MNDKFVILKAECGCVVEKHIRSNRLPLYVIAGQKTGITEFPFAAGANPDTYMARVAINNGCPHRA